eukprot:6212935-Pleurochrysis_carterae.AAC.2
MCSLYNVPHSIRVSSRDVQGPDLRYLMRFSPCLFACRHIFTCACEDTLNDAGSAHSQELRQLRMKPGHTTLDVMTGVVTYDAGCDVAAH